MCKLLVLVGTDEDRSLSACVVDRSTVVMATARQFTYRITDYYKITCILTVSNEVGLRGTVLNK